MSFKATNYLLFESRKSEVDYEYLQEFSPYMTNRTLSFYSDGMMVEFVNDTLNVYGNVFSNKEDQFRFYQNVIPKLPKQKINYIKKSKQEKMEKEHIPEFYSQREIDMFENMNKYCNE
jgi:hypothetical protein